jgi:hypothetical protein
MAEALKGQMGLKVSLQTHYYIFSGTFSGQPIYQATPLPL